MIAEFLFAQKELLAQVKTTFEIVAINEVCKERAVGPGKDDILNHCYQGSLQRKICWAQVKTTLKSLLS
jgi:hypothetical protein